MKTILVPVDFSKNSDNACRYAIAMAKQLKAEIILLHVFETPFIYSDVPLMTLQMDYSTLYNVASKKLKSFHSKIKGISKGVRIHLMLQQGLPSARIKEIAQEKNADLIVIGITGKGAVEKVLVGSNTARILRETPCMVMAVPSRAKYSGLHRIVYATDLSDENLHHAQNLIPFAKKFNAEILFLNVNTTPLNTGKDDLDKTIKKIKKHISYAKTSGYLCYDITAANGINYFLKKNKADCVVMYPKQRNFLTSLFSSSATKKVVAHATIPVLAIHKKDFTTEMAENKPQRKGTVGLAELI